MGNGTALQRMLIGLTATVALLGAPPALAASAPVVSTGAAQAVTATSATLTGTVNPEGQATTYQFQYGLTTSYGNVTPSTSAGSGTTDVPATAMIGSLSPNTTYHYRIVATNATGPMMGADQTFKTAPAPPTPVAPAVNTGAAKSTTLTSATLTGTVNPEGQATTYHFQYGLTTSYGGVTPSASAGSGTKNTAVTAAIGSLTPNTTYHYRIVATNATGTTMGADRSFKTAKPSAFRLAASPGMIVFGQTTRLSGKVSSPGPAHTTVTLQRATSRTGPFTTVATTTSSNNGAYSFVQKPGANTFYRAVANGMISAPVRVAVRFRITLFVGTTHPARGQRVRFHGSVAPRHNGFRVRIQRLGSDGRWHTIARALLHQGVGNSSAYSKRIRVHRSGRYRATVAPDAHHARGFSRVIRIQVR